MTKFTERPKIKKRLFLFKNTLAVAFVVYCCFFCWEAREQSRTLSACIQVCYKIEEFIENNPTRWPPSWEDLEKLKWGEISFSEAKERVQLDLPPDRDKILQEYPRKEVTTVNYSRFIWARDYHWPVSEYKLNWSILWALRLQKMRDDEEANLVFLEKKVEEYNKLYGSFPKNLKELVEVGLIEKIPQDPFEEGYFINSKGEIRSRFRERQNR